MLTVDLTALASSIIAITLPSHVATVLPLDSNSTSMLSNSTVMSAAGNGTVAVKIADAWFQLAVTSGASQYTAAQWICATSLAGLLLLVFVLMEFGELLVHNLRGMACKSCVVCRVLFTAVLPHPHAPL